MFRDKFEKKQRTEEEKKKKMRGQLDHAASSLENWASVGRQRKA